MNEFEYDKEKGKFFGEYFSYQEGNEQEKEEAKTYLNLWKKNLLRKLHRDSFHCEIKDEQWGEKPAYLSGCLAQNATMYLKLYLKAKWDYELR
jgi:hypothetical protein